MEYLPSHTRGKAILSLAIFWAIGCLFEAILAWGVMTNYGWRYLIALSTIPLFVFLLCAYWMPESPLYLATVGRREEMEAQIKRVSQDE